MKPGFKQPVFPLAAIVGQPELRLGLMLNAVNPAVGGILIRGEKGTAKSTMVRALAAILPRIQVVANCRFSCDPDNLNELCPDCKSQPEPLTGKQRRVRLVNLPLNATEDRVAGGINFSKTLKSGRAELLPGLLAEAHRGILYIDEVNLLDDHIVDLILDAAASGRNIVEREGLSLGHAARLILIGTMNPEEGELRPQLLDRFGLCVEIKSSSDIKERVSLLERREKFDLNPPAFMQEYAAADQRLQKKIEAARKLIPQIRISSRLRIFISELCCGKQVAGHRADLIMEQAAKALAALDAEKQVTSEHILKIAGLVLSHRQREAEPPPPPSRQEEEKPEPEPVKPRKRRPRTLTGKARLHRQKTMTANPRKSRSSHLRRTILTAKRNRRPEPIAMIKYLKYCRLLK